MALLGLLQHYEKVVLVDRYIVFENDEREKRYFWLLQTFDAHMSSTLMLS
jgi:hypothetical protein